MPSFLLLGKEELLYGQTFFDTLQNATRFATIPFVKKECRSHGWRFAFKFYLNPTKEVSFLMIGSHDNKSSPKNQAFERFGRNAEKFCGVGSEKKL